MPSYLLTVVSWDEYIAIRSATSNVAGIPQYCTVDPINGRICLWPRLDPTKQLTKMVVDIVDKDKEPWVQT